MGAISNINVTATTSVLTADTGTIDFTPQQTVIVAINGTETGNLRNDLPYNIEYIEDGKNKLHQGMMYTGKSGQNYTFKNP